MTEKECLQAIVKGWSELAINPELSKYQTSLNKYLSNCPACEYVREEVSKDRVYSDGFGQIDCLTFCPMIAAWPKGCTGNINIKDSLFMEWLAASTYYDKCFFAALIAEWGEYLLNELEEQSHENRQ